MIIKELHIRNIASIEKADIDFENGLNEAYTGTPAPIFLISGDTGAGKSVILDAIALALYKTTPRLTSKHSKNNNEFVNSLGEKVRVFSIQQYTRLGIAPDDDCYSEVVFEGNDGLTYTVRLTLGLSQSKKKVEGAYIIKYSKPEWLLTVDGHAYSKEDDIKAKIERAVGLSFDQFSRMAMLAQGQFASFLTGDKEERETILERLTNTKHFSDYGEAITSLYKRAKAKEISCSEKYKLESQHTIEAPDLAVLQEEKNGLDKQKDELGKSIRALEMQIGLLTLIEANQKAINDAQAQLIRLEDVEALRATFATLAADLADREGQLGQLNEAIEDDNRWLEARKEQEELYTKAGEYLLQLDQLKEKAAEIERLGRQKKSAEDQVEPLQAALDAAKAKAKQAQENVTSKQQAIEAKIQERNALKPAEINQELERLRKEKSSLEKLQADILKYNELYQQYQKLLAEIEEEKKKLATLQEDLKKKDDAFNLANNAYDHANRQYGTMSSSVGEILVDLRRQLAEEHAKTCPLCGQSIEHDLLTTDDFKHILTPLEEEKDRCKKAMEEAQQQRDAAKTAYDTAKGTFDTRSQQAARQQEENKKEHQRIVEAADSLHLDPKQKLLEQIETRLQAVEKETDALTQSAKKAEALHKEINALLEEKKPLEKAKNEADAAQQKAAKAFDDNEKAIKDCGTRITEVETKKNELVVTLSAALKPVYPDWADDIDATMTQLNAAAKEYKTVKTRRDERAAQAQRTKVQLESLGHIKADIIEKHPDWDVAYVAAAHPSADIAREWSTLLAHVSQNLSDIASQHTAIANAKKAIQGALAELKVEKEEDRPEKMALEAQKEALNDNLQTVVGRLGAIQNQLDENDANQKKVDQALKEWEEAKEALRKWTIINEYFGGARFRTLVQTYVLRPLLNNANIYLQKITSRYELTCSEDNEQLSILVLDNDNKKQVRSATLLSGGERFMISLALSLALSSLNRPDLNVNILFIDEGFGTLDEKSLDSVMETLGKLQDIAGLKERRVGIISHRTELEERIPVQIRVEKRGEGRSQVFIQNM